MDIKTMNIKGACPYSGLVCRSALGISPEHIGSLPCRALGGSVRVILPYKSSPPAFMALPFRFCESIMI